MANNRVNVSLAFTADTKQAKKQIDELQNTLSKLATFDHFEVGDVITEDLLKASNAVTKLQSQLKQAFNQDTGRIDLSKFKQQLDLSGMSIDKYRDALITLGPEGERAFLGVARAIQNAEIPLKRSGKLANELWITLKNTARWQISASIIQGFQGALQKAYGYAQDLNESLNNIRIVTNYSVDDMAKFAIEANKAAKALSTTTTEYTNASLIYYQQGLSAEEVKERTDVTIKMANVSRESAETVSDQMTAVWNNFADGSRTLEYYADVMTALGAATASSTAEITTGLEKFAAVAETVGLSYEYATTALATITDTTRQSADVVGNALKTLFARIQGLSLGETLEDGTDLTKYSEALAKVGIAIKEQDGSLKDMDTILDEMANKWETLAKDQQVALAQTVAGVRQYTQLVALMDNWDKFQKNLSVANNASGSLQEQADIYAESWEASRERVQAALESIFNDLVNDEFFIDLNNALAKTIGLLDQMIDNFGGLEGVIAGLGVVLTKVFNKQITQSISNLGFNLKQRWTSGSEEEALKASAANSIYNWYNANQTNVNSLAFGVSDTTVDNYGRIAELQIKLNQNSAAQTEEQKEINAQLIQRLQNMNKLTAAAEHEARVQEERINQEYNELLNDPNKNTKKTNSQAKNSITRFKNQTGKLGALTAYSDALSQGKTIDELKELQLQLQKTYKIDLSQMTADDAAALLGKEIKKTSNNVEKLTQEMKEMFGLTDTEAAELVQRFQQVGSAKVKALSSQQDTEGALNDKFGDLDMEGLSQGFTNLVSGISEVAFGLQSLSTITDTLNNQDLTWGEKTLSIIQSVAFGVPSLINGLGNVANGLSALSTGLSKLGPVIAAGKVSWISYNAAGKGVIGTNSKIALSFLGIQKSLGAWLIIITLVIGAIAGLVAAWNHWKSKQPEALLKNATKEANHFKEAIANATQEIEALKDAFDNYESIQQTLAKCTKGTKEWSEALANANANVLELIEKYPKLAEYITRDETTGQLSFRDGYKNIVNDYEQKANALRAAATVANNQQNKLDYQVKEQELKNRANTYRGLAGYGIGDQGYSLLKEAIEAGTVTTTESAIKLLQANGYVNAENVADHDLIQGGRQFDTESVQNLITSIRQLNATTATNNLLTKENSTEYARLTLTENKKVQNSTEKAYIEAAVGEALPDIIKEIRGDQSNEDIYSAYVATYGSFAEGSKFNAKTGQVTDQDGNILATVGEMVAELYAIEITTAINAKANELTSVLANRNSAESGAAVLKGTGDVGNLTGAEYKELFANQELVPEALKTAFNNMDPTVFEDGLEGLEYSLAAGLRKTMGDNSALIGDIFEGLGAESAEKVANIINQIDWSNWDADDNFAAALNEAGLAGKITAEDFELLTNSLRDSNNAVKDIELDTFKSELFDIKGLIGELEKGDTIKAEDYAKLNEVEKEYFTLASDGTYMLTEDAKKFYDTVVGNRLEDAKERITQLQSDINEFDKAYEEFQYYGGDADKLNNVQSAIVLLRAGIDITGMTDEEKITKVKELTSAYEDNKLKLNEVQAVLASMAEDETTLNKWLDEGKIDAEEYDGAMEVLRINQEKALKALNANVKGLEKSAPKITKALEAMNKGLDVKSPAFIEAINEVIEANPDLTGAVMSAYQALTTAKVGTEEYTKAWNDLYQLLQHNASLNILEDNAEAARDAMEVLDDKTASVEERANVLQNLNTLFGSEIFTDADKGVAALDNLRKALDGDKEAFKQLQEAVLEGILVKYNVGTGDIDLSKFEEGCIYAAALADDVREALIASGLFEIVETEIDIPDFDYMYDQRSTLGGMNKKALVDAAMGKQGLPLEKHEIKTKKVKVQLIKPIGQDIGVRSMSSSSSSSGSKGTKKVSSDEKERYHVVNKQIEDLQAKYDEAGKIKDQAFGPAKESAALTELGYLDQLIEKERQYQAEIEQYLAKDKSALAEYGATFGEHGEITNYDALMDKEIAKYNAAIEKAGTNQKAQEAAEKAYDLFIKALENYEGTYSAYLDKLATIQDLQNEKIDKELQNIQDKLDAKLDLEVDQLKYLDYLIGKLDDEAFALADALVSLHDKTQPIMNQSDHYAQAWEELQRTAKENGGWTQDMIDKLRELRDGLISTNEEIMELQKTIEEKVNEAIAECTDELDKQINRFDTYQSILQNYNDIIDLSGEKFKDYAMMLELSSLMTDNAINKLASSREKLETLGQAQINAQAKLELAEDSGDQDVIDYWKKTLEDIQIEVENATAEMGSAWKEALQAASDAFESQVNLAIDNFKGGLEAFGDLDMISESYDRAEKAAERYLEDFEKTHELSQLGRDITKAMNDTTSAFAKDELAELMAEVNEKQKDGVKMSEYDLEVLKKKFELKQAELALEEAQNSMSQVRLTRDNEGNWSYQYTADQDKVDEALNEYETRLYEVAKLSDEYIDEMSSAIIQNQKDMYEALAGLRAEDFASYEEYEAKVREIVNFYTTQDAYLRDELAKAVGDTETITTQMSAHYNNLSTSFTTVVDTMLGNTGDKTGNLKTWMESTDNLAEQAEEYFNTELPKAYEKWEESVADAMEAAGTNTEDFKDDVSGYMGDIGDASEELAEDIGDAADDMEDYIESVMDAVWDWQKEYAAAIREMIAANEELIRSMMAVAAAQGAGTSNVSDYSLEIAKEVSKGTSMDSERIKQLLEDRKEKMENSDQWNDSSENIISNAQLEKLMELYIEDNAAAKALVKKVLDGDAWLTDAVVKPIVGFRTGGYTGAWGPEGKMAMVHEKELVLNSDDTINFLAGVNILREIAKMIDLQAANMAMPHGFTLPMSASSGGALEQNVHISASFPGVQDRNEIEIALRSLVNEASQFVLE